MTDTKTLFKIPTRPRTRTRNRVVALVGLVGISMVIGEVVACWSASEVMQRACPTADRFLNEVERHEYAAAFSLVLPKVKPTTSLSLLKDCEQVTQKHFGQALGHTGPTSWNVYQDSGSTSILLVYTERRQKGDLQATIMLARYGGKWGVRGYSSGSGH